jgi:hypothetical protein
VCELERGGGRERERLINRVEKIIYLETKDGIIKKEKKENVIEGREKERVG